VNIVPHRLDPKGVIAVRNIKARKGEYAAYPPQVRREILEALARQGIKRLYAHQAEAVGHILSGRHTIVTTSTSSGKSLVYTIPVLNSLLYNPSGTALYITPAKALAQNQRVAMVELTSRIQWPGPGPEVRVCDGDTPWEIRKEVLETSNIVLSTPDFMHATMLPRHRDWSVFFQNLSYVVLDEAHVFRGLLGASVCHVMRRLRRLCQYYKANPVFILCTATIGNPQEFAANLIGDECCAVEKETAPTGNRQVVLYEPPRYRDDNGDLRRRLTHLDGARALGRYVKDGQRVIMFGRSRRIVESSYRKVLQDSPHFKGMVTPYKGTYTPADRRLIEERLFSGDLKGCITTSALELGIDIGNLSVAILAGFPGSISSTWQQWGRVGRNKQNSVAVLMAGEDPLDLFLVRHPDYFFSRSFEKAVVDPNKTEFMAEHLLMAARELPLEKEDRSFWDQEYYYEVVKFLHRRGNLELVSREPKKYCARGNVACFGLRGESETFRAVGPEGKVFEQFTRDAVLREAFPGAILFIKDRRFSVDRVDEGAKTIDLKPLPKNLNNYITLPHLLIEAKELRQTGKEKKYGRFTAGAGELEINKELDGYWLVNTAQKGEKKFQRPQQRLSPVNLKTTGLWLDVQVNNLSWEKSDSALHTLEHLLHIVIPWQVMCERSDVDTLRSTERSRIYVFDNYEGGVGLAEGALDNIEQIIDRCYEVISSCTCGGGCPSCIHIPQCRERNDNLSKEAALELMAIALGVEREGKSGSRQTSLGSGSGREEGRAELRLEARALGAKIGQRKLVEKAASGAPDIAAKLRLASLQQLNNYDRHLVAVTYLLHREVGPVPVGVVVQALSLLSVTREGKMFDLRITELRRMGMVDWKDGYVSPAPKILELLDGKEKCERR